MKDKTKNDVFNLFIYGVFITAIYGLTLVASSYFGIGAGIIIVLGLAMIVHAVFNFKYLELFKRRKKQ